MSALQKATATPFTRTIDKVEYTFSPLRLIGLAALEQWARQKIIAAAAAAVVDLPLELRRDVLQVAMESAARVHLSALAGDDSVAIGALSGLMESVDGNMQIVLQSLKYAQPRTTIEHVENIFMSLEEGEAQSIVGEIMRISGFVQEKTVDPKSNGGESSTKSD